MLRRSQLTLKEADQQVINIKRVALIFLFLAAGCEMQPLSHREQGALTGGALGAGLGAIVGNQVGSSGAGIAIGSAIGAISGGLVGNSLDADDKRHDDRQHQISDQQRQLDENRKMLDELRAKGTDARITDRGVVVNLPDVLFRFNSADLTPKARETAQEIVRTLGRSSLRRVSVEGHTDSIGTASYNQKLSLDRARSVADELARGGMPRSRLSTRGYGESRPVASNATESGRQKNRRVEVIIENR
jgi:outer membrane protein OmpA-like peptidoglycan-associated protein